MKKITHIAGQLGSKLVDRSRSVKLRVLHIARAARAKGKPHRERLTGPDSVASSRYVCTNVVTSVLL